MARMTREEIEALVDANWEVEQIKAYQVLFNVGSAIDTCKTVTAYDPLGAAYAWAYSKPLRFWSSSPKRVITVRELTPNAQDFVFELFLGNLPPLSVRQTTPESKSIDSRSSEELLEIAKQLKQKYGF